MPRMIRVVLHCIELWRLGIRLSLRYFLDIKRELGEVCSYVEDLHLCLLIIHSFSLPPFDSSSLSFLPPFFPPSFLSPLFLSLSPLLFLSLPSSPPFLPLFLPPFLQY